MKKLLSISKQPTLLFKTVLISLLFSILIGCSEKTLNDNPGTKIDLTLDKYMHNGRLVFKDQEVYQNHLNWIILNQGRPSVISDWNSQIGLVSMKEIYDDYNTTQNSDHWLS